MRKLIAIIGSALLLGAAWGLDSWVLSQRSFVDQALDVFPLLWITIFAELLIASGAMILAWYAVYRLPRSGLVGLLLAVAGLIVTLSPIIFLYSPAIGQYLYLTMNSLFRQAGAFVFLIGLANLFIGRRPRAALLA